LTRPLAGKVDENAAHHLRGDAEEVGRFFQRTSFQLISRRYASLISAEVCCRS
jgi:hypothetical protein